MRFEKLVRFIGFQENVLNDGGKYYTVTLFVEEIGGTIQVNVMLNERNFELCNLIYQSQFGDTYNACFRLVAKDKLYKISLVSLVLVEV